MPPCAAMECARRGESWKQKHLTLYPSSLIVAAAAPPARPVPTTMTVYFRLLAGFTSFMWSLRSVHFFSSGPAGILEFKDMALLAVDEAREDGHGDGDVGEGDERRGERGEPLHALRV